MNYFDLAMLIVLSFLTGAAIDLGRKSGIRFEQGRKGRATILITVAGLLQIAAIFLALHIGHRVFSI